MNDQIPIAVTHPRSSEHYPAQVAPACTARIVLAGLQDADATPEGPFLELAPAGRPYVLTLARTATAITPDMTMAQAGVRANDVLVVDQMGPGASWVA